MLFVSGVVLLCWTPVSMRLWLRMNAPWPFDEWEMGIDNGGVVCQVFFKLDDGQIPADPFFDWYWLSNYYIERHDLGPTLEWRPRYLYYSDADTTTVVVGVPLWLLSLLCLAWPVSSFIIARRKQKRGFPVEPSG